MQESQAIRKHFDLSRGGLSYLEWDKAGSEAPLLHFAHANGMNAYTYWRLMEPMADKLHLIAADFRGHGLSDAPADPQRLKNWQLHLKDFERFIESFGRPVYLAGHSMGAVCSIFLAARRPDLVRGLVICDPVIMAGGLLILWRLLRGLKQGHRAPIAIGAASRRAVWPDRQHVFETYRGRGGFTSWPDEWLQDYLVTGLKEREDGKLELACDPAWETQDFATAPHTTWGALKKISCPICLIYGGKSDVFTSQVARRFSNSCPDARKLCIEEASHFVVMEYPEKVREEILQMCLGS